MKNVLLATTALVAIAGAASAEMTWGGSAAVGYNDGPVPEGYNGFYVDSSFNIGGSVDLGDGVTASFDYGFDVEAYNGTGGLTPDAYPTIEVSSSYGSLLVGDLNDKGASEYYYADRSGMALDIENHDSGTDMGVRAMVQLGQFGLTAGGQMLGTSGTLDGVNIGAGATFGNFTLGFGYDEADSGTGADSALAQTAVSLDTTFGALSAGVSYIGDSVDSSVGVEVSYAASADLTLGAYYASNTGATADQYGASADYTMGAMSVSAYYDFTSLNGDEFGVDAAYAVSDQLTVSAGVYSWGTTDYYIGADYAINDSITATVAYSTADEISGPEYNTGTTVELSMTF